MTFQAVLDEICSRQPAGTGETITIVDPVTEEIIGEFSDGGPAAVDEAVGTGPVQLPESAVWHGMPGSRSSHQNPRRAADLIDENADLARRDRSSQHRHARFQARPARSWGPLRRSLLTTVVGAPKSTALHTTCNKPRDHRHLLQYARIHSQATYGVVGLPGGTDRSSTPAPNWRRRWLPAAAVSSSRQRKRRRHWSSTSCRRRRVSLTGW